MHIIASRINRVDLPPKQTTTQSNKVSLLSLNVGPSPTSVE